MKSIVLKAVLASGILGFSTLSSAADLSGVPSGLYQVDPTHAYVTFSYNHLGMSDPVLSFDDFTVDLELNNEDPTKSTVMVTIDANSIVAGSDKWKEHLVGDKFFDTANHPEITFNSTSVEAARDGNYKVMGDLTIKGVAKPVALEVTINAAMNHPMSGKPVIGLQADSQVLRSEFGMKVDITNMSKTPVTRYSNIAISLHWLMAFLIIGMLVVGKYMHHLETTDPLRFTLTQWHKTFGVLILLLAVFRLMWRMTHRAPSHPENAPGWERLAANLSHLALYALIFIAPLTGWMMVSVSPLNIDTYLFNVIPWPHIPWLQDMVNKESAEARFHQLHVIATGALIALLLLHISAALKHHFVDKDTVLVRMSPARSAGTYKTLFSLIAVLSLGIAVTIFGYIKINSAGNNLIAGNSDVRAVAIVSGEATDIHFPESTVTASINQDALDKSTLLATVTTASVISANLQVSGPLPDVLEVTGLLNIKGIEQNHTFNLTINESNGVTTASGEFVIDRMSYQLGLQSQPNDDYVNNDVTIAFEFSLSE